MSGTTTELEVPQTLRVEDVTPPPEPAVQERPRNPREEMMMRIAQHYNEGARQEEIAYGEQMLREASERAAVEAEPEEEPPAPVETAPAPPAAAAPAPAPAPPVHQAPHLRTVEVQGQHFQVTEDQYAQLASMGAVAHLVMRQQAQAPQPTPQPQPVPQAPPAPSPALDRERAAAIHQRLSYGSAEDGVAAIQELAQDIARNLPAPQQLDPVRIRQDAVRETMQHIQVQNDLGMLSHEYPQVWHSRALTIGAVDELNNIRQRDALLGVARTPIEQYREACNNVMAQLPSAPQPQSVPNGAPQAAPQAAPSAERLERKRAAPRNPVIASRVASLGDPPPPPPTAKEIVESMRRARFQSPMN